ncbi:MAG: hypothetical protein R3C11_11855 [Planctomycetaceae bacterium]
MSNILIVDDEPAICWALEQALQDAGHDVQTASSAEEALELTSGNNRANAALLLKKRMSC